VVAAPPPRRRPEEQEPDSPRDDVAAEIAELGAEGEEDDSGAPPPPISLPFARRDLERLRLVQLAQRRLREAQGAASARRAMAAKTYFDDAVRWMEIHGGDEGRDLAASWRAVEPGPAEAAGEGEPAGEPSAEGAPGEGQGRRRRRRRRRPRTGPATPA
jgi:hypothetical protein